MAVGRVNGFEAASRQRAPRVMGSGWIDALFPQEVAEVGNRVGRVSDQECLSLIAVVFVAVHVGQNGRDLSVYASTARVSTL